MHESDSKMVVVGIGGTGADVLKSVHQRLQTASDDLVNASNDCVVTLLDSEQGDSASTRSLLKQSEDIQDKVRTQIIDKIRSIHTLVILDDYFESNHSDIQDHEHSISASNFRKYFPRLSRFALPNKKVEQPTFSLTHELGHVAYSAKEYWRLVQVTDSIREQTSQLEERLNAILRHAEFSEPDIYQKAPVLNLFKSLEVFREQLDIFQQAVQWLSVVHMPLYVAWAWLQTTSKDFTGFLRNLGSFIDKILYLSGIHLTQFCVKLLPPDLGPELQALYDEQTEKEASNLNILISIISAFLQMQVALLIMDLDDSSEDGLVLAM